MKLNMGCGHNKRVNYINVDQSAVCLPDQVVNLEVTPWPWPNNSVDEVLFENSLEHIGHETHVFLAIIQELYRVCKNDAIIKIDVPHPRHDYFIDDPTHVRAITPLTLQLFSRRLNDLWKEKKAANSPLAHYLNVDFEIETCETALDEPYLSMFREGQLSQQDIAIALREKNNVAHSYHFIWRVIKKENQTIAPQTNTAFIFEPDWTGLTWVTVVIDYLNTYTPGSPVALVIPLDGSITLAEAKSKITEVFIGLERETFPDLVLLDHNENPIETLRRYSSIQWIH